MISKPILIVDDEKNIRLTLSQALETLGAEIDTAANGEEALAKLKGEGVWFDPFGHQNAGDGWNGSPSSSSRDTA